MLAIKSNRFVNTIDEGISPVTSKAPGWFAVEGNVTDQRTADLS